MLLQELDSFLVVIAKVALVLGGCALLLLFVRRVLHRLSVAGHMAPRMEHRLRVVASWLIVGTALAAVLHHTGLFSDAWAVLSAILVALAVGFVALWSVLSNIVAALLILGFRPFRLGDEIELVDPADDKKGLRGRVSDLSLMFTTLEEGDNDGARIVTRVPNNMFFQRAVRVRIPQAEPATRSFYGEQLPPKGE